jgi:hypothetical protein
MTIEEDQTNSSKNLELETSTKPVTSDNNTNTNQMPGSSAIIELNVGGVYYTSTRQTLLSEADSYFAQKFAEPDTLLRDSKNKVFIDRDGLLFRYVLDYLRAMSNNSTSSSTLLCLPENFNEKRRLRCEAEFFKLPSMCKLLDELIAISAVILGGGGAGAVTTTSSASSSSVGNHNPVLERQLSTVSFVNNGSIAEQGGLASGRPSIALSSVSMSGISMSNKTVILPPINANNAVATTQQQQQHPPSVGRTNRKQTLPQSVSSGGCIVLGYRGTFSNGRDGLNDVKFRKISRILGKQTL